MKKLFYPLLGVINFSMVYAVVNSATPPLKYPDTLTPAPKSFKSAERLNTKTPIKHVVVIFQENISFDRYFGVYPHAANLKGDILFTPKSNTPKVNGYTETLLSKNPNSLPPIRLNKKIKPCSNNHDYYAELGAVNGGLMNRFVESTGDNSELCRGQVMGYYDGNTVTALWNYAQNFSLNDNAYGVTYGPSTPGALNLVAGSTGIAKSDNPDGMIENGYIIDDPNPYYDDCSYGSSLSGDVSTATAKIIKGKNIGDILNNAQITWGWFAGGFRPDLVDKNGTVYCNRASSNIFGESKPDYLPHHEPFQYYASTANPHHLAYSKISLIGSNDVANHQYDLSDFMLAAKNNKLPAVSFLKPIGIEDGHGGYSNPVDEQRFLVTTINAIQSLPQWKDTAIIVLYDDSDGDYDHVYSPKSRFNDVKGRRGFGPRLPFMVISPWAKSNYIDHTLIDQSSVIKFIEYNWGLPSLGLDSEDQYAGSILNMFDFTKHAPKRKLILNPTTGQVKN